MSTNNHPLSTGDAQTVNVPIWKTRMPAVFHTLDSYFRNIIIDDLVLEVKPNPVSGGFSELSIAFVDKKSKPNKKGDRPMVKITGPPLYVKWANLQKTGDFPSVENSTLQNANFSLVITEGKLPDKPDDLLLKNFKELEKEQQAFFDWLVVLETHILKLMYDDSLIRAKDKKERRDSYLKMLKGDASKLEETLLLEEFFSGANKNAKKDFPFVRNKDKSNTSYPGRFLMIKKAIASKITIAPGTEYKKKFTEVPADSNHYINLLYGMNKEYNPPTILLASGKAVQLGFNDHPKPIVESGDYVVPSFFAKVYDCGTGYGVRPLYCYVQMMRKVKEGEISSSGVDMSEFAEEYEPFEEKATKRKQPEANDDNSAQPPKKIAIAQGLSEDKQQELEEQARNE